MKEKVELKKDEKTTLKSFLSSNTKNSSIRLMSFITIICANLGAFVFVIIDLLLHEGKNINSIGILIIGMLSVAFGFKMGQRFAEPKIENTEENKQI